MGKFRSALLCALALWAAAPAANAVASEYYLRGARTDLFPMDVDYFSQPLKLHRIKGTFANHIVEFDAARYVEECGSWQRVCVGHDSHGNCTSWENRCVQWVQRQFPVHKQIEIDFRSLVDLKDDQEEVYELEIHRQRPMGTGEDWVTTWLKPVSTQAPVNVIRGGDFQYTIRPKQ